jgi:hypothetical protein
MGSNINVKSNLMIVDDNKPEYRYLPGDYVGEIYPGMVDNRVIERELTRQQIIEYKQYLPCLICNMPCAGSCK